MKRANTFVIPCTMHLLVKAPMANLGNRFSSHTTEVENPRDIDLQRSKHQFGPVKGNS
jgi:hypothetical protein